MKKTPKGLRLHIGIFGRRNVGKSSFLNAITKQEVSIVSDVAGTTTDPVQKAMELLPIGPVLFIDTAGIDDEGSLGKMRVDKTIKVIERIDVAVLIVDSLIWGDFEENLIKEFQKEKTPIVVIFNKVDKAKPNEDLLKTLTLQKIPYIQTIAKDGIGTDAFKNILVTVVPESFIMKSSIVGDLIQPGQMVVLVVPIDLEAPKGRLILPQVQTIRDVLDHDSYCTIVKERELRDLLDNVKRKPALVVTDSQAFLKVSGDTPGDIPMTSFSILFARFKGDLSTFVKGAVAIENLRSGDKVLIAESCSHHPIGEDIGRVKIPRWLTQYVGGKLNFDFVQGHDFPKEVNDYSLVIHCGSCTFNRRELLTRIMRCKQQNVPITNYGIAIAYSLGIFERALKPFPGIFEIFKEKETVDKR